MNTFVWKALVPCLSLVAYTSAMRDLNDGKPPKITIEAFTAFKVNGLWVVTITYK